jgi:hypothetical protein
MNSFVVANCTFDGTSGAQSVVYGHRNRTDTNLLSDVKKEMRNESNRGDKDRDPEAVLGGF